MRYDLGNCLRICIAAFDNVIWNLNFYYGNLYICIFAVAAGIGVINILNDYCLCSIKLNPTLIHFLDYGHMLSVFRASLLTFRLYVFVAIP